MPLLSRPLQLHDARDVEALMWKAIASSAHAAGLREHERADLCAFLIGVAWETSLSYNSTRGQVRFTTFVYTTAKLRIIDWVRKERGRTVWSAPRGGTGKQYAERYERERPVVFSLDDPEHGGMGTALARSSLDRDAHSFAADMRALAARGRRPGREDDRLDDEAA